MLMIGIEENNSTSRKSAPVAAGGDVAWCTWYGYAQFISTSNYWELNFTQITQSTVFFLVFFKYTKQLLIRNYGSKKPRNVKRKKIILKPITINNQ